MRVCVACLEGTAQCLCSEGVDNAGAHLGLCVFLVLQILKVLNVHNDSLSFIESKSR